MKKINSYISRTILKSIFLETNCFASWMRAYISPKELYLIKEKGLHSQSIIQLKVNLNLILSKFSIEADIELIEYLIKINTKLDLILKFIRSGFIGNFKINFNERKSLLIQILSYRINKNQHLSLGGLNHLSFGKENNNSFIILGPVCPDYSYVITDDGRYRYTFESIGSGIGLVAKKAIKNINLIKELSNDLIKNGLNIDFKILLGDFEATPQNLKALKETKISFLKKVSSSRKVIEEKTNIKTILFTDLCNGLSGWRHKMLQIKKNYNLYHFNDLNFLLPEINHERNFISRLPLYKKWFGINADYKDIFVNQTIEYILMGNLLSSDFFFNPILLASDHKAMRDYYTAINNLDLISSSAEY